jgi:hypothetical protein
MAAFALTINPILTAAILVGAAAALVNHARTRR